MEPPDSFDFPFEPYPIQHDFMHNLYEVIEKRKLGIFESPTGTGKSLSIICGAVRWLKDHHTNQRAELQHKIDRLQAEKESFEAESTDWLSTQCKQIALTRQINELKIELNQITEYDKKIENLKIKNKKKTDKNQTKPEFTPTNKEEEEDEDLVLENHQSDTETDSDDEDSAKYKPTKIIICSRTHSQLTQFIGEVLKSHFANDLRVVSFASRQNYCINPNVAKLKYNSLINEKCLDIQKQIRSKDSDGKTIKQAKGANCKCPYYKQSAIEDLKDAALLQVQDIEDLVKKGKELNACPYYSSRLAAEDAEVVLVPYNTILHKATREANGINIKDNIIIIDEAHNLLEAMAQMHSCELNYQQIEHGLIQLKCYKQRFHTRFSAQNLLTINQLIFIVTKLQQLFETCKELKTETFTLGGFVSRVQIGQHNLFKLIEFCKNSRIARKVRSYALKYPFDRTIIEKKPKKGVKDFLSTINNKTKEKTDETDTNKPTPFNLNNPLLAIIAFLESLTYSHEDGRIFVHFNQDTAKAKLQFLLLNPSENFKEIVLEARSVVVAGGTMKPMEEFKERLFINSGASPDRIVEYSCDHIIPQENILPIVVTQGPNREKLLFSYEHRLLMGNCVKSLIVEACKTVVGGIVVFFPSYNYENFIWQQIKDHSFGRAVFREPQDSGSVDGVLKAYADAIKKTKKALLLSVVGGKLSEGLNFSDDLGRCVMVVGLPYANIMAPDLKEKMAYLDTTEGSGAGKKFYEGLCMKAVNQSIGRAVRHKNDFASILLVDERFNRISTKNALPDWIQRSLIVCDFKQTFFNIGQFMERKQMSS